MKKLNDMSMNELLDHYEKVFGESMPNEPDLSTEESIRKEAIRCLVEGKPRKQDFRDGKIL